MTAQLGLFPSTLKHASEASKYMSIWPSGVYRVICLHSTGSGNSIASLLCMALDGFLLQQLCLKFLVALSPTLKTEPKADDLQQK